MPDADLHVHTTRSDGTLELEEIPDAARAGGVHIVALTDHDRLQPFSEPIVERDGITIVHGIELRVEPTDGERIDLLGYAVEPTSALERLCDRIQENRRERAREICERVEDRLGVELEVAIDDGIGRPHIARAIDDHPDSGFGYQEAFDDLIGDGDPCYVPRTIPSFDRGRAVLTEACQVVSLAHPLRYQDPERALELAGQLDAVEREYPYGREVEYDRIDRAIDRHDLLVTGGSDAHGTELGRAGLTDRQYDQLSLEV